MTYAPYAAASRLDEQLGNPEDTGRLFSYARCAAMDSGEEFPLEICRELDLLGLPRKYVPACYGGTLHSYDEGLTLMRAVARRDLTVAIGHGKTFLGAVSVWIAGDTGKACRLGAEIAKGALVCWALTERDHGSDLLAGELRAERVAGGYRIFGEKWLVNNATRSRFVCLLARTAAGGGPRGFSLLLIDKRALDPAQHRPLPMVRLHGIRGTDISGIAFDGAEVPDEALVGADGQGLELVLKSLQLTRILCASLSLGAGDQGLELATGYLLERHNYGRPLIDLPQSRRLLALSYADLLLAESVSLLASRAIHTLPGELAVISAVTKYFVPTLIQSSLERLARLLGTRSLLADSTYRHGRFQKVRRDHRIVSIFDGSTVVNLQALINVFPALRTATARRLVDTAGLQAATTLAEPLPEFDPGRLTLVPRAGCSVLQALPGAVATLQQLAENGAASGELVYLATRVEAATAEVQAQIAAYRPQASGVPATAFRLAERYAGCFAAAAAIQFWLGNRLAAEEEDADGLWSSALWLEACLARLAGQIADVRRGDRARMAQLEAVYERLVPVMLARYQRGDLLSLLRYPVPRGDL